MLSVAGNNGDFLAVFAQCIKLICVSSLYLLTRYIRKLSFGDKGFGFGADELLLEDNNLGRVGLLVLELGNLIRDLGLACEVRAAGVSVLSRGFATWCDLKEGYPRSLLGCTEASMFLMLFMVTRYWS